MGPSSSPCYPIDEVAEDQFVGGNLIPVPDASLPEAASDVAGYLEQTLNVGLMDFLEVGTLELASALTRLETAFVDSDHQIELSVVGGMEIAWAY